MQALCAPRQNTALPSESGGDGLAKALLTVPTLTIVIFAILGILYCI